MPYRKLIWAAVAISITLGGCGTNRQYQIDLMPAPAVYDDEIINPLAENELLEASPYQGVLYVTDRLPAGKEDKEKYYLHERSPVIRAGQGTISLAGDPMTWEEVRAISLAKTRTDKYPLRVDEVLEFGVLQDVLPYGFLNDPSDYDDAPAADTEFSDLINKKIAVSKRKDIYIYVHGYKVVFENPLLVSTELWHFLGYDGVFIAYSWPSTPKTLAYFKDVETAELSGRNLRLLLKYLAENTDAERIHLVGYSSGTRVIITALHQLALEYGSGAKQEIRERLRIANVSLVGSDYDRAKFSGAIADGLLNISAVTTVYESEHDSALNISRLVLRQQRLGQMLDAGRASPTVRGFIRNTDDLYFVDVSDAEESDVGNGHAYFRNSPWASSDLLMTLMYNLSPEERGLVREEGALIWRFPPDYISKLRTAVIKADPGLVKFEK